MTSIWIWMSSKASWQTHLNRAYITGVVLYDTLSNQTQPPEGITLRALPLVKPTDASTLPLPEKSDLPTAFRITTMSITTEPTGTFTGNRMHFHIVSPDLQYPIAKIVTQDKQLPAEQLGGLARLLASYCSDPFVFVRIDQGNWTKIDASSVWGCNAAPLDLRLFAASLLFLASAILFAIITDTAKQFSKFSSSLKQYGQLGRRDLFKEEGPDELRDVVKTLNEYLTFESERLENRAMVLSGVSHDLGTPATRLRLRTALIEDDLLREKLESDIDQMTGMIESVLTYTRSEMNAEEPRNLSITSLVQSIVADYEDTGQPVSFEESPETVFDQGHSVFGGGGKNLTLKAEAARRVLSNARPVSLRRAIMNLIDNSLKYGRKARVSVGADSEMAQIVVEDEGMSLSIKELNDLTEPFSRGENANFTPGVGLGLTIVATIAQQHGGSVTFDKTATGTRATLTIRRT